MQKRCNEIKNNLAKIMQDCNKWNKKNKKKEINI